MDTNKPLPLHIFRAGQQTAMNGVTYEFTADHLAAAARAYDPALHEAPIVVGHPTAEAPAYGWVQSLAAGTDGLTATPHQVDAAFAEMVTAGRFKKISASFYLPDAPGNPVPGVHYLRHVGFLGAQPPAVKGLRAVEFSEGDAGIVEFGEWGLAANASLWRRLREFVLAKFGQEAADQVAPDWEIESMRDAARADDPSPIAFADPIQPVVLKTEEYQPVTPEQKAALEAENVQLKAQLAAAAALQATAVATARHADHVSYAETLVNAGTLAPKHLAAVAAFLDFAEGDTTIEFGEGTAKQPLATAFKAFLGDLPKVVEFGESATKGRVEGSHATADFAETATDPSRLALHHRATALAGEKNISYEQAVQRLL